MKTVQAMCGYLQASAPMKKSMEPAAMASILLSGLVAAISSTLPAEPKNFTVFFENDMVTRWEGDYFPNQDAELARKSVRQFGRNLAKDKKKGRGR